MNQFSYSATGLALTKSFEGFEQKAYRDVGGIWTVGYGHTGVGVREGLVVTEAEATMLLESDLAAAVACVNRAVTSEIVQYQFDAVVDYTFNVGRGSFLQSTLLLALNNSDFAAVITKLGNWVYAGGVIQHGLVRRRAAEAKLFSGVA